MFVQFMTTVVLWEPPRICKCYDNQWIHNASSLCHTSCAQPGYIALLAALRMLVPRSAPDWARKVVSLFDTIMLTNSS